MCVKVFSFFFLLNRGPSFDAIKHARRTRLCFVLRSMLNEPYILLGIYIILSHEDVHRQI